MPITDSKPTSDNPQTQAPQNVQYAAPYPQQFEDDTIDLKNCGTPCGKKRDSLSRHWFLLGVIPFRVGSGILNTRTVEAHRQEMMAKLNVVNMAMLVSLSVTHKLVTTD